MRKGTCTHNVASPFGTLKKRFGREAAHPATMNVVDVEEEQPE
jgi:hypothetical protein